MESGPHVLDNEGYLQARRGPCRVVLAEAAGQVSLAQLIRGEGQGRLAGLHLGVLAALVDKAALQAERPLIEDNRPSYFLHIGYGVAEPHRNPSALVFCSCAFLSGVNSHHGLASPPSA
jgi:hypothetical protein